ncbi:unnamed protein product, partial [marine sediment metagenome]
HIHVFKRGELVDVYIEPQLYDKEGSDHFFLRVVLHNTTDQTIGLDMVVDPYWSVLFPNQYVIQNAFDQEHPMIEHQITPITLSFDEKDYMMNNYKYGELSMMKPDTYIEYYRDFTGFHKKKVKLKENQKITLSFDGQMFVTDGKKIEEFNCFKETDVNRFVMIYHPAKMHALPENGFVLDLPEEEEPNKR